MKDHNIKIIDGIRYIDYSTIGEVLVNKYLDKHKPKRRSLSIMVDKEEGGFCFVMKGEGGPTGFCGIPFAEDSFGVGYKELLTRIEDSGGEWFYD